MMRYSSAASMGADSGEFIEVVGARQNNLKGINLKLPLGELTVVTGVSGSGKLSLAFDTKTRALGELCLPTVLRTRA